MIFNAVKNKEYKKGHVYEERIETTASGCQTLLLKKEAVQLMVNIWCGASKSK